MKHGNTSNYDNFAAGFVSAFIAISVGLLIKDFVEWLLTVEPSAAVIGWWTTPFTTTPVKIVAKLIGFGWMVLIGVIFLYAIVAYPRVR